MYRGRIIWSRDNIYGSVRVGGQGCFVYRAYMSMFVFKTICVLPFPWEDIQGLRVGEGASAFITRGGA